VVTLPDGARALVDASQVACVGTIYPEGQAHLTDVWILRDGNDLLFSTIRSTVKYANLRRDPRVSALVVPPSTCFKGAKPVSPHRFCSPPARHPGMLTAVSESLSWAQHVASWRREVHALYADVRATADPSVGHETWVRRRTELFERHPASPRQPGQALQHAAYDPAYRFAVRPQPAEPEDWRPVTGTDGEVPFERVALLELPGLGTLDVWWLRSYGNGIFVPVRDATAGRTTYGAGRYLLDTVKGADLGRDGEAWVVDLNFAYNPSCAYDPAWACPLAPAGNRLDKGVAVGELNPATA
jgi:uncharacterized protein